MYIPSIFDFPEEACAANNLFEYRANRAACPVLARNRLLSTNLSSLRERNHWFVDFVNATFEFRIKRSTRCDLRQQSLGDALRHGLERAIEGFESKVVSAVVVGIIFRPAIDLPDP